MRPAVDDLIEASSDLISNVEDVDLHTDGRCLTQGSRVLHAHVCRFGCPPPHDAPQRTQHQAQQRHTHDHDSRCQRVDDHCNDEQYEQAERCRGRCRDPGDNFRCPIGERREQLLELTLTLAVLLCPRRSEVGAGELLSKLGTDRCNDAPSKPTVGESEADAKHDEHDGDQQRGRLRQNDSTRDGYLLVISRERQRRVGDEDEECSFGERGKRRGRRDAGHLGVMAAEHSPNRTLETLDLLRDLRHWERLLLKEVRMDLSAARPVTKLSLRRRSPALGCDDRRTIPTRAFS